MNSVQLHLALTHVPVILSLTGLIMLIAAFFIKNTTVTRTAFILIVAAGVSALPVYFSGEGTEEVVENLPGVSESFIERHEDVAKLAMISVGLAGLLALAALLLSKSNVVARFFRIGVLLLSLASGALMIQTAHLGGQIRHSEIRSGVAVQSGNESGGEQEINMDKEGKDHD